MSDSEDSPGFQFPEGFETPYKNAEFRNDNLQVKAEMLNEPVIHEGVRDLLKKK